MKKILGFMFLFLVLFSEILVSQEKYMVSGYVKDAISNKPLTGANVVIEENNYGAITDINGYFEIGGLSSGTYDLRISLIGYKKILYSFEIGGKNIENLDFALNEILLPGQTVVVTAMRGKERVTPVTFSTLEREELEKRYTTQDIPALLSELPSTTFYSENGNGIGYNYLNIRGFDQRRISVMINGVPQNDPEDHNIYWLDFPDLAANLEDVQVQRGAGSAFYGPASIGGSINLITSNFSRQKGISVSAGLGSYNTKKYSFSVNSGLIGNKYSFYGRLSQIMSAGYRDKSWVNFNSFFLGAIRYDEDLTTQIHVYGGPIADHLAYYGIPKEDINNEEKRKQNPIARDEEIENFSQPHYELLQEWKVNNNLTFNHTLFFIEGEGFFNYDASWGDTSYFRMTVENGFSPTQNPENALVKAYVHNKQWGWLPRITLEHTNGDLTAGLEIRKHNSIHWGKVDWAQNLSPDVPQDFHYYDFKGEKVVVSLYVHELYRLLPTTNILCDLQYSYNRYRLYDEKFIGTDFAIPYNFFNPRIGINYNVNKNLNTYLTLSYVSREPKLNNIYDAGSERDGAQPQFELKPDGTYDYTKPLVKPENLFNTELGFGYNSDLLHSTLNLYWMEFSHEIVKSGQLDRFGQPITGNADKTRHIGAEVTFAYKIISGLELSGNFTISKNTFIKNSTYLLGPGVDQSNYSNIALDGNRIAGFPDFLSNLKLSYKYENFYSAIIFQYVGIQFTDNFGNLNIRPVQDNVVDPYSVFNYYIDYNLPSLLGLNGLNVKFQINNLFNKLYATHGESEEFFPAAGRNIFLSVKLDI